jgi:hypothetical protein
MTGCAARIVRSFQRRLRACLFSIAPRLGIGRTASLHHGQHGRRGGFGEAERDIELAPTKSEIPRAASARTPDRSPRAAWKSSSAIPRIHCASSTRLSTCYGRKSFMSANALCARAAGTLWRCCRGQTAGSGPGFQTPVRPGSWSGSDPGTATLDVADAMCRFCVYRRRRYRSWRGWWPGKVALVRRATTVRCSGRGPLVAAYIHLLVKPPSSTYGAVAGSGAAALSVRPFDEPRFDLR